eukprot:483756-Pleurochrysis_carterae.AAC.4
MIVGVDGLFVAAARSTGVSHVKVLAATLQVAFCPGGRLGVLWPSQLTGTIASMSPRLRRPPPQHAIIRQGEGWANTE